MRKLLIIVVIVLASIVTMAGVAAMYVMMIAAPFTQSSGPRPTDADMVAHWRAKRPLLERLVRMLNEDAGVKRIGKTWSEPPDLGKIGIGPERLALYRALFREASILSVSHYGKQIEFVYFTEGIYVSGGAKSFCFGPPPDYADRIDGDLDKARVGLRRYVLQRRIEGDWWLQSEGT